MDDSTSNNNPTGHTDILQAAPRPPAHAVGADVTRSHPRDTALSAPVTSASPSHVLSAPVRYLLAGIRIALGWIFLWAFLDKLFGLGHDTPSGKSWLHGGSPTKGFLASGSTGPFAGFYRSIAGSVPVDVLFMAGLLGLGAALILGIGIRIAAISGALLTVMMWTVVLPPDSNPFLDDHLVYAAVLILLALLAAGDTLGLGRTWAATPLVRRAPWLT